MKLYGLYSDKMKCLMGFSVSSNNEEDFCGDVIYSLVRYRTSRDSLWVTEHREIANEVARIPTEWYNADYNHPEYNVEYYGMLRVVNLNDYTGQMVEPLHTMEEHELEKIRYDWYKQASVVFQIPLFYISGGIYKEETEDETSI